MTKRSLYNFICAASVPRNKYTSFVLVHITHVQSYIQIHHTLFGTSDATKTIKKKKSNFISFCVCACVINIAFKTLVLPQPRATFTEKKKTHTYSKSKYLYTYNPTYSVSFAKNILMWYIAMVLIIHGQFMTIFTLFVLQQWMHSPYYECSSLLLPENTYNRILRVRFQVSLRREIVCA